VITVFIDGLGSRSEPSNEGIKQCGNRIHDLGKDGRLTLNTTAGENNANIIGSLIDSLEETLRTVTWFKLLLAHNYVRNTAWHVAAEKGQLAMLHKLWEWAKYVLTRVELNYTLFLAKDGDECITCHMETEKGQTVVLHNLWNWAKNLLIQEEINNIFLIKDRN